MSADPVLEQRVVDSLRQLFGDRMSTATAVRAHHGQDGSYHAGHDPDAVVYPTSSEEVLAVLELCSREGVPIIPYGVGTSLEGH
ncbi:MAG: FAD-binding protein, partial [Pseudomonadota bacterium]|nr:FAD-binding protein [Pseudomonadota bacterium]